MARSNRKRIKTYQKKDVQAAPSYNANKQPKEATVRLDADLTAKYLGRGMMGISPYLEVLQTSNADSLLCEHGYSIYRRMSQDPEIDAGLNVLIQSTSSQPLKATPGITYDNPNYTFAQDLSTFINWMFDRIDIDQWRKEALRGCLTFGNSVTELDWDIYDEHAIICGLRLQQPENYGLIVDRWGEVYGAAPIGQAIAFPLSNLVPLSTQHQTILKGAVPRYKLSVWTWEKKGTDPRGTSALIPVYIPWWSKQRAIEEWSCWIGRFAQPSIVGITGPDALTECTIDPKTGREIKKEPTEKLFDALSQFASASILSVPNGTDVKLLQVNGGAEAFISSINLFNKEISRGLLGQHLATGEGDNQSRAAAEVHALVLRMKINSTRRFIARQIQKDIIEPVIEANFGDVGDAMPKVNLGDSDGWPLTLTEVALLFQAGYFDESQMPELDEIVGAPIRKRLENGEAAPRVNNRSRQGD